jgi:hypothetical protein
VRPRGETRRIDGDIVGISSRVALRDLPVPLASSREVGPARGRPGFRQDRGVREAKDPDGFLMLFGEAAEANERNP